MKKELLSPVGNWECLKQAIHNGADAVYLGGKKFGARAFAENFTEDEIIRAIKYCHLYGVKIYVTINTMIYENELEECLNYIRFLHQNNVDAIIMQDIGLIKLTREKFPDLEIHASTQMHNHNQEQLKFLSSLGIKRVVLSRELSLEEIKKLDTKLEIEAFIHGALCISYSGQCLFSSLLMERSGNRGACAGICRLPFTLIKNDTEIPTEGPFLLSPKELNTLDNFKEIMESNIDSLKIEGRMKSPAYLGFITKLYRTLMDNYNEKKSLATTEEQRKNLALLFNRGFTRGHMFHDKNEDLMNSKTSNHQGIPIGEVLEITKNKIKLYVTEDLNQEDGIRFASEEKGLIVNFLYNEKGLLTNKVPKNSICYVDNKIGLKNKGKVLKTMDSVLINTLEKIEEKKIPLSCKVTAKVGEPLEITIKDGKNEQTKYGKVIEKSLRQETTSSVIKEKMTSLGNTPFIITNIQIEKDENIFIPMSELKNLRREIMQSLQETRENSIQNPFLEKEIEKKKYTKENPKQAFCLNALVRNEEQLKVCLEENIDTIYVTEESLYQKFKENKNIFLRLSRVKQDFKEYNDENLLVGETGALYKYRKKNNVITDYYLNVANSACYKTLIETGAKRVTLPIENKINRVEEMLKNIETKENIELIIYGRPEVMIMKHCLLNRFVNKENPCKICLSKDNYYLKDRNNKLYPIKPERKENHLTHLFHYKEIDLINDLKTYQNMGIQNYRIELFDETEEEIRSIIRKIKKCQI